MLTLLRRPPQTINTMADALGLTDNAVRAHVAALGRDGLVEQVGTQRDTGGKPARLYALTPEAEELFPKAYATVLAGLIEQVAEQDGWERAVELLRAVGAQMAGPRDRGSAGTRLGAAAAALRKLGGDVDIQQADDGWLLKGYACPLAALTSRHHEVCELAQALVEEMTGLPVTECCERGDRPRCGFKVARDPVA